MKTDGERARTRTDGGGLGRTGTDALMGTDGTDGGAENGGPQVPFPTYGPKIATVFRAQKIRNPDEKKRPGMAPGAVFRPRFCARKTAALKLCFLLTVLKSRPFSGRKNGTAYLPKSWRKNGDLGQFFLRRQARLRRRACARARVCARVRARGRRLREHAGMRTCGRADVRVCRRAARRSGVGACGRGRVRACEHARTRACARACMHARVCVRACAHARVRVRVG